MAIKMVPGCPALVFGSPTHLVISDLHLGYERKLEARGIFVPEQTSALQRKLEGLAASTKAKRLVVLGDVKDELAGPSPFSVLAVRSFFQRALRLFDRVEVVPGNHDGGLEAIVPAGVTVRGVRGLVSKDDGASVGLFHGHAHPSGFVSRCDVLVTGHQHFTLSRGKVRQGVWLKGTLPSRERQVIVMPAFNDMLAGSPLGDATPWNPVMAGLLKGAKVEVFLQDGTLLGTMESLKEILEVEVD